MGSREDMRSSNHRPGFFLKQKTTVDHSLINFCSLWHGWVLRGRMTCKTLIVLGLGRVEKVCDGTIDGIILFLCFLFFFSVFFFVFVLFFGKFMLFFVVVVLFRLFPCYFGRLDAFCLYFYTTVCCVLTLYVQCLGSTLFVWAFFCVLGVFL